MKKTFLKWLCLLLGLALIICVSGIIIALALPGYIEKNIVPRLIEELGVDPKTPASRIPIRRVGLTGADLGPLTFGPAQNRFEVASLQVNYRPWGLLQRRIQSIVVSGLNTNVTVTATGVQINGLALPFNAGTAKEKSKPARIDLKGLLPFVLERVQVRNAAVRLTWRQRRIHIPFDLELATAQLPSGRLKAEAVLRPRGNRITVQAAADSDQNDMKVTVTGDSLWVDGFADLWDAHPDLDLAATMAVSADAQFRLQPFAVRQAAVTGRMHRLRFEHQGVKLGNSRDAHGREVPVQLSIKTANTAAWQAACSSLLIRQPFPAPVLIEDLRANIRRTGHTHEIDLTARSQLPLPDKGLPLPGGFSVATPIEHAWTVRGTLDQDDDMTLKLEARPPETASAPGLVVSHPQAALNAQSPTLNANVKIGRDKVEGEFAFTTKRIRAQATQGTATLASMSVNGRIGADAGQTGPGRSVTITVQADDVQLKNNGRVLKAPRVNLKAGGSLPSATQPLALTGTLQWSQGRYSDPAGRTHAGGLALTLPVVWPPAKAAPAGKFSIRKVVRGKQDLGGLQLTLRQTPQGIRFNGRHRSKLLTGLNVRMSGRVELFDGPVNARFEWRLPAYRPPAAIDLGRWLPAAVGITVNGTVALTGQARWGSAGPTATAMLTMRDGRLAQTAQQVTLDGIDIDLKMDDLMKLKSAPQQTVTIKTIQWGKLALQDFSMDYQTEPGQILFIEKSRFRWAGGVVNTQSLRLSPQTERYALTLFCDRLNLAQVLAQLGAAEAQGDGTVNGSIPLLFSKKKLIFEDGFLYSTPGKSGTINLTGAEALLKRVPKNTPQFGQLDLALEALKDYAYKWAKVNLKTEGEELLLLLQLDGKPNRKLPFAYDRSLGMFKRIKGEGQSDFKGIGLDVNFRLPLEEILKYKNLLNQQ